MISLLLYINSSTSWFSSQQMSAGCLATSKVSPSKTHSFFVSAKIIFEAQCIFEDGIIPWATSFFIVLTVYSMLRLKLEYGLDNLRKVRVREDLHFCPGACPHSCPCPSSVLIWPSSPRNPSGTEILDSGLGDLKLEMLLAMDRFDEYLKGKR